MPLKQLHSLVGSHTALIEKLRMKTCLRTNRQRNTHKCKCCKPGNHILCYTDLLETFQHNNALLDDIQKCLEAYLESKRVIFSRYAYCCFAMLQQQTFTPFFSSSSRLCFIFDILSLLEVFPLHKLGLKLKHVIYIVHHSTFQFSLFTSLPCEPWVINIMMCETDV